MGLNLARGEIFTTSIGSVDLLYTGRIVVCKKCNILSKLKALKRDSIYNIGMFFFPKKSGIYCKCNVYCRRPGPCHLLN